MTKAPEDVIAAPIPIEEDRPSEWPWILALLLFSGAAALTWSALQVPPARPASETDQFSAERAHSLHQTILGTKPRPLGSAENALVRQRIVDHLQSLGYQPELQEALVTSPGSAAIVHNVMAKLEGREPQAGSVLLLAHHDSVGAGPGASDDGAGVVALLDIAAVLRAEGPRRRSVIFLWTDGEEVGLYGARAFAEQHPWAKDVQTVINLEARGSSGPARLFETGPLNLERMRRFASVVERPSTTSIANVIYERMPNDTDFTVFRHEGRSGYNLAFIGDVENYHATTDTLENQDPGSLQHLGDQALALARVSADAPDEEESGEASWFDIGGRWLLVWDVAQNLWILGGAAVLLVLIALALFIKRGATLGSVAAGLVATLLLALAGFLAGHGLEWVFRWIAAPSNPELALLPRSPWAGWFVGAAAAVLLTMLLGRRVSPWGLWLGTWTVWLGAGITLHFMMPAAAYPFLVPAGIAAFFGLFGFGWVKPSSGFLLGIATAVPAGAAAVLWLPLLHGVAEGLGADALWIHVLLASLLATTLLPAIGASGLIGRVFLAGGAIIGAATCVAVTILGGDFSEQQAPRIGLGYDRSVADGSGRWLVVLTQGQLPEALQKAGPFEGEEDGLMPGRLLASALGKPSPSRSTSRLPSWRSWSETATEDGLKIRARLRSTRGASQLEILSPPSAPIQSVQLLDLGGHSSSPLAPVFIPVSEWQLFRFYAVPASGAEIELTFAVPEPAPLHVRDRTLGLPAAGRLLVETRDRLSQPSSFGDGTWVDREVTLSE